MRKIYEVLPSGRSLVQLKWKNVLMYKCKYSCLSLDVPSKPRRKGVNRAEHVSGASRSLDEQ